MSPSTCTTVQPLRSDTVQLRSNRPPGQGGHTTRGGAQAATGFQSGASREGREEPGGAGTPEDANRARTRRRRSVANQRTRAASGLPGGGTVSVCATRGSPVNDPIGGSAGRDTPAEPRLDS